jgi:hypothetical protein
MRIQIDGGDKVTEYSNLTAWLDASRDFRSRVSRVTGPPVDGQLDGGLIEMLTVAVGSGGIGVALTASLNKWLETRRPDVTVTVTVAPTRRTVKLRARHANKEALALLRDALRDTYEP